MFRITSCNVNTHKTTLNADNIICIFQFLIAQVYQLSLKVLITTLYLSIQQKYRRGNKVFYHVHSGRSRNKVGRLTGFPKM